MDILSAIRSIGAAAVALGVGAGFAVLVGGCAVPPRPDIGTGGGDQAESGVRPPLPIMDAQAPAVFQTASFGFG
jgi:hypothetical protein